jgi:phosphoglucan,water dikinase
MAVLIEEMVDAEVSFVMHTVNPIRGNPDEIYIELAAGLGETIASGRQRGTPYRFVSDKRTGAAEALAFASYSLALRPGPDGGLIEETVDYSTEPLTISEEAALNLMARLTEIGVRIEQAMGGPQDVEGAVRGDEVYLLQARPQMGVQDA